ncbi:unnamed protein product [Clavelina lepadiformis]|uniref:Uncharacterized protein n=1 Tax=Clavelina lepadiformis TaxID=159417 RepID=A0ABP0F6B9_CLALP
MNLSMFRKDGLLEVMFSDHRTSFKNGRSKWSVFFQVFFYLICFEAAIVKASAYYCINHTCICTKKTETIDGRSESLLFVDCHDRNIYGFPEKLLMKDVLDATTVDLSENMITSLPKNMLFNQIYLKRFILYNTTLDQVDEACFNVSRRQRSPMSSPLQHIDLRDNNLNAIPSCFGERSRSDSISTMENVKTLLLGGNFYLSGMSDQSLAGVRNIQRLDLSRSSIRILPHLLLKFHVQLVDVDLSHNALKSIPNVFFVRNTKLLLVRLNANLLRRIPSKLPKGLEELLLALNKITFVNTQDVVALQRLQKLKILDLSQNGIQFIASSAFYKQIELVYLDLSQNALDSIGMSTFDGANKLEFLFLENNKRLSFVAKTTFSVLPRLQFLFIFGCSLTTLNLIEETEIEKVSPLKSIWFFDNPVICNCKIIPFIRHLKNNKIELDKPISGINISVTNPRVKMAVMAKLKDYSFKISPSVCISPTNRFKTVVGRKILEIPENYMTCPDEPFYVIVSILLGIASFAFVIPLMYILIALYLFIIKLGKKHFGWTLHEKED